MYRRDGPRTFELSESWISELRYKHLRLWEMVASRSSVCIRDINVTCNVASTIVGATVAMKTAMQVENS